VVVLLIEVEYAVELLHVVVLFAHTGDEEAAHLATAQDDAFEANLAAQLTKEDNANELFARFGDFAEAIDETLAVGVDFVLAREVVELLIESDAFARFGHVGFAERNVEVGVDGTFVGDVFALLLFALEEGAELLRLELLDGLLEDLLIGLIAEVGDEARLLAAQQVACATDVEVLHGEVYARTEAREVLDGLQTATRILSEVAVGWGDEVTESLLVGASHTTAQLMEFGEAEVLRIDDNHRIGIGDVKARFDDGGADENVVLVVGIVEDELLHDVRFHLAVGRGDACVGDKLGDTGREFGQLRNLVVDDEDLSVARQLEVDGLLDDSIVETMDLGLDGVAVGGRGSDDAEVASSHEAELQGAGDGSGCHGKRIDVDAHGLERLLDLDAELLFLVDDEEAEVGKLHLLADELMGADDDVDVALGEVGEELGCLFCCACSRQVIDAHREVLETFGEGTIVLIGEHGGGDEHRHLLAVVAGLECGTDGHLGLAEAHIAADETVHGTRRLHVAFHLLGGLELVGRVLEHETGLQLVLHL